MTKTEIEECTSSKDVIVHSPKFDLSTNSQSAESNFSHSLSTPKALTTEENAFKLKEMARKDCIDDLSNDINETENEYIISDEADMQEVQDPLDGEVVNINENLQNSNIMSTNLSKTVQPEYVYQVVSNNSASASRRSSQDKYKRRFKVNSSSQSSITSGVQCDKCKKVYKDDRTLYQHQKNDCGRFQIFNCDKCTKSYLHYRSLLVHKRSCHNPKPFQCFYCSHRADRKPDIKKHISVAHKNKPVKIYVPPNK